MNLNLSELNFDLDINKAGEWPNAIKITAQVLLGLLVFTGLWYFLIIDQNSELESSRQKEVDAKSRFESKYKIAAQLKGYQQQYDEIENSLFDVLKQLPTDAEIAILLNDISTLGKTSGLDFESFKPDARINKDFYSIIPIKIKVKGNYNDLGTFVSGLAAMSRIVTIHDVNMKLDKESSDKLIMEAVIKTYSELPKSEQSANQQKTLKSKVKG